MRRPRGIFLISLGAAGAILLVVFLIILRFEKSKREVIAYRAALEAKGQTLSAKVLTASAPSESNEAANQLLAQISDLEREVKAKSFRPSWAGMYPSQPGTAGIVHLRANARKVTSDVPWADLEQAMSHYRPILERTKEILHSHTPVFHVDFSRGPSTSLPCLPGFIRIGQMLGTDSMLDLHAGRTSEAVKNVQSTLLMVQICENQQTLIDQLVVASLVTMASLTTWELLQASASNEDLKALQKSWEQLTPSQSIVPALRMERAFTAAAYQEGNPYKYTKMPKIGSSKFPSPAEMWEIANEQFHLRTSRYSDELAALKGYEALIALTESPDWRLMTDDIPDIRNSTGAFPLSGQIFRAVLSSIEKIAIVATVQELAIAAIAIQRYRQDHSNQLPATLENLVPQYLSAVPHDLMDGKPLRYKPGGGTYLLYGIGFDGVDDGGNPEAPSGKKYRSYSDGRDIVWPKPVLNPAAASDSPPGGGVAADGDAE